MYSSLPLFLAPLCCLFSRVRALSVSLSLCLSRVYYWGKSAPPPPSLSLSLSLLGVKDGGICL